MSMLRPEYIYICNMCIHISHTSLYIYIYTVLTDSSNGSSMTDSGFDASTFRVCPKHATSIAMMGNAGRHY